MPTSELVLRGSIRSLDTQLGTVTITLSPSDCSSTIQADKLAELMGLRVGEILQLLRTRYLGQNQAVQVTLEVDKDNHVLKMVKF